MFRDFSKQINEIRFSETEEKENQLLVQPYNGVIADEDW